VFAVQICEPIVIFRTLSAFAADFRNFSGLIQRTFTLVAQDEYIKADAERTERLG